MGKLKYIASYLIPLLAILTFYVTGLYAYIGLIFLYIGIPIIEYLIPPNTYNLERAEKELTKEDLGFDLVLYVLVILQLVVIYLFCIKINDANLALSDIIARTAMLGTVLGSIGINVGHELGHKTNHVIKQIFAQVILTTSFQNHFITYHNGGHHKDVGTPKDLSSAREGDNFYLFAVRSQIGGYFKTWGLESGKLQALGKSPWLNPMIIYSLLPIILTGAIFFFAGQLAAVCYVIGAMYGISILESQNYYSHYGLRRKQLDNGRYERVKPHHSWNSDHILGRIMLFELTRHSDHHHMGAKEYQILDSKSDSPKLPFGYPAMQLLAYFPFLFKPIMKRHLRSYGIG